MPNYSQLSQEEWAQKEFEKVREMRWQNACKIVGKIIGDNPLFDKRESADEWFKVLDNPPWQRKDDGPPDFVFDDDGLTDKERSIIDATKFCATEIEWVELLTKFSAEEWFGPEEQGFYNKKFSEFMQSGGVQ